MDKTIFQNRILEWFFRTKRPLPWRQGYAPYHVWISEMMLQQTQMDRAVTYFEYWVEKFPDIRSVAEAGEDEILKAWEGLGYYSRARNIHKAAKILLAKHGGALPDEHTALLALPGIGPYTAGAIMSLAFNAPYPIVDANIERVFARICNISELVKGKRVHDAMNRKVMELIPEGRARDFNQALMELGALTCKPKNPECHACPVRDMCEADRLGLVALRPVLPEKKKSIPIIMVTGILIHEGRLFVQKRLPDDIWANLWEFPGGRLKEGETPRAALVREFQEETGFRIGGLARIMEVRHSHTIYRVVLHCYYCRLVDGNTKPQLTAAQEARWIAPGELGRYAFPAGHRKLIAAVKDTERFRGLFSGEGKC